MNKTNIQHENDCLFGILSVTLSWKILIMGSRFSILAPVNVKLIVNG